MLRVKGNLADSQSIITKADLLKPKHQGINGTMKLPYSEETLAAQKNAGNLYVQDYTGVNPVIGNINSAQGAWTLLAMENSTDRKQSPRKPVRISSIIGVLEIS